MRIFRLSFFTLVLAICLVWLLPTPSFAQAGCPKDSPRCWYMIFGTGDAPRRDLFLARLVATPAATMTQKVEVLQVMEAVAQADYVIYGMEFNCKTRKYRIETISAATINSKFGSQAGPPGWKPLPQNWVDRAHTFACNPKMNSNPDELDITYFMNFVRPADLSDLVRKFLWGNLADPSG